MKSKNPLEKSHYFNDTVHVKFSHKPFLPVFLVFFFSCTLVLLWRSESVTAQSSNKTAAELNRLLKNRLESFTATSRQYISGEPLYSFKKISDFYSGRGFSSAWVNEKGMKPVSQDLMQALSDAPKEGLEIKDYHTEPILALTQKISKKHSKDKSLSLSDLVNLEILLSDAFLTYGSHLLAGRVDPNQIDEEWIANRRDANLPQILEQAFENGRVRGLLKELLPTQKAYSKLRAALARYRKIEVEGGWSEIPAGFAIKSGSSDARVKLLRKRLWIEGDLKQEPNESELFDDALERALIRYQKSHGLEPDGTLGKETLESLNVPVKKRIEQIILNMERCRWLPQDLGEKHIVVNIADYSLQVVEKGSTVMNFKVVVGKRYRRTPVFSSVITEIVLNPSWTVPTKIARLDILKKIQKDPNYLAEENFTVYDSFDENARIIEWKNVDWSSMTAQTLTYKFRQKPGPKNALGRIKFFIVNDFDVYLHGTPSKELFKKTVRSFSSGCIRVENPIELAAFLLHNDSRWSAEELQSGIDKKTEQFIRLPEPMPIHLLYWTAWEDEQGKTQFRNDIYRRDERLQAALLGKPLPIMEEEEEDK